jgi:hypothetical protein
MADDTAGDDELAEIADATARAQARRVIDEMRARLHAVHAPPDFHARGMARIRQLPPPQQAGLAQWWTGVRAWQARSAVWVPALATALMLSLALNIGLGVRALRPRPPGARPPAERLLEGRGAGSLPTYQFQAQLQHAPALGALVAARPVPKAPHAMVGFTPDAARPTFVRLGILYANTLAALRSGALEAAGHRLGVLIQTLVSLQAPPVLSQYLREMQAMLQRQPPAGTTAAQFVALFEPLYEAAYATDPTAAAWVLFRTGAWLENLALAAAVGDQALVRQTQAAQSVQDALRQLHMPAAVLEALEQLQALMARQPMTAQDLRAMQTLVDALQQQLSGGAP